MQNNITQLLNLNRDDISEEELYRSIYHELKRMARGQLNKFSKRSLDTTELVHEAYLKLRDKADWQDRGHFFAVSAIAMRHILVNLAEKEKADKRNISAEELKLLMNNNDSFAIDQNILSIDEALNELEKITPRACRVVEFRVFASLDSNEIAKLLDVSLATVKRDWALAKNWVYKYLKEHHEHQ